MAEKEGLESVQHFIFGDHPVGEQTSKDTGLTKQECKFLYTRYPNAIKRDLETGLLTLPLVPKGTVLQIKPEPDQKLSDAAEKLFDAYGKWTNSWMKFLGSGNARDDLSLLPRHGRPATKLRKPRQIQQPRT